jgi:hypothetical protein
MCLDFLENSEYDQAIDRRMSNPVSIGSKSTAVFSLFPAKHKGKGIEQIGKLSGLSINVNQMR